MTHIHFLLGSLVFVGLWLAKVIMATFQETWRDDISVQHQTRQEGQSYIETIRVVDVNPATNPSKPWYFAAWLDFATAIVLGVTGLVMALVQHA